MLAIRKVPTVVSLHQEDADTSADASACAAAAAQTQPTGGDWSGTVAALSCPAGAPIRLPLVEFSPADGEQLHVAADAALGDAPALYGGYSMSMSSSSSSSKTDDVPAAPALVCPNGAAGKLSAAELVYDSASTNSQSSSNGSFEDDCSMCTSSSSSVSSCCDSMRSPQSVLERTLLSHWRNRAERGLFKYDVTACESTVLDGAFAFVAQLNEGRATTKRPTEFRVDLVCQPFDESKFNFCKAAKSEILFAFMPDTHQQVFLDSPDNAFTDDAGAVERMLSPYTQSGCVYHADANVGRSPTLVLLNISPIEYGHVLLVPRVLDKLPQRIRQDALAVALHFSHECNTPSFKVGYNSLGAYATINHLHFQAYFLDTSLPLENANTEALKRLPNDVLVERTTSYPVRCFVFHARHSIDELAAAVARCCETLQEQNVPFNLLIADRGMRVFVIPNCFAERIATGLVPEHVVNTGINPAAFEISGHLLYKRRGDYEEADECSAIDLLTYASMSEEGFETLADRLVP